MESDPIDVPGSPRISGHLEEVAFSDLCQTLIRQPGLLKIVGAEISGRIFFAGGRIVHAEAGEMSGRVAVVELATLTKGQFQYFKGAGCPRETIKASTESILMEAALYTDYFNELVKRRIGRQTRLKLVPGATAQGGPTDDHSLRALAILRDEPQSCTNLLTLLTTKELDRAEATKVVLELIEGGFVQSAGEIEKVERPEDPGPALVAAPAPVAPAVFRPPIRPPPGSSQPKRKSGGGKAVALIIVVLLLGAAAFGGWKFYPSIYQSIAPWLETLEPKGSEATLEAAEDQWNKEVDATVLAAHVYIYGSSPGGKSDPPMTPVDIIRFNRSGFTDNDLILEVRRRGFTGFPDSIEEERARSVWGARAIDTINQPSCRLTQAALDQFVTNTPFTRTSSGLVTADTVKGANAAKAQVLEKVIARLEEKIKEAKATGAPTTVFSLKLLLLRQQMLDMVPEKQR